MSDKESLKYRVFLYKQALKNLNSYKPKKRDHEFQIQILHNNMLRAKELLLTKVLEEYG